MIRQKRLFLSVGFILVLLLGIFWFTRPVTAPAIKGISPLFEIRKEEKSETRSDELGGLERSRNEEERSAPTLRQFPPPSIDLTGSTLGRQRIEAMEDVGDVFQVHFDLPSFALFMAVIEKNGLRSVWRMDQYGKLERVFAANTNPGEIRIFGDSKGVLYVQYNNPFGMVRTDNRFKSWHDVNGVEGMFWDMADNGKGHVWGTLHDYNRAMLFHSPDDGFSWETLVDFQNIFPEDAVRYDDNDPRFRLRHLHGVIYNDKRNELIVGTGDVARYTLSSRDEGKTWKKIWDEGFTSHITVGGGNRYLLGPDKLRGPGIVLYDAWKQTVEEVFNPGIQGYAGYTYSMANVDGIYYVAFHTEANEVDNVVPKFGIIVSPDARTWYPFLEWGPLGNHARTDIWITPSPGALFASVNGALYQFSPLTKDWFNSKEPFSQNE